MRKKKKKNVDNKCQIIQNTTLIKTIGTYFHV